MASPSATPLLGKQEHWIPGFPTQALSYILIAFMIIIIAHNFSPSDSSLKSVPIINPAKSFSFLKVEAKVSPPYRGNQGLYDDIIYLQARIPDVEQGDHD